MKELFESYKHNLPIILLLLYAIGSTYLFAYYSQFNIEIELYVNLTDILFFALRIIAVTIFSFLAMEFLIHMIGSFVGFSIVNKKYNTAVKLKNRSVNEKVKERYQQIWVDKYLGVDFQAWATILCIAIIVILVILISRENLRLAIYLGDFLCISFPYLLFRMFIMVESTAIDLDYRSKNRMNFSVLVVSLVVVGINGVYKAYIVKSNSLKSNTEITLTLEKGELETSRIIQYVGSTSNYIFFYDLSKNESIIIDKDYLLETRIHDKRTYTRSIINYQKL